MVEEYCEEEDGGDGAEGDDGDGDDLPLLDGLVFGEEPDMVAVDIVEVEVGKAYGCVLPQLVMMVFPFVGEGTGGRDPMIEYLPCVVEVV